MTTCTGTKQEVQRCAGARTREQTAVQDVVQDDDGVVELAAALEVLGFLNQSSQALFGVLFDAVGEILVVVVVLLY